MKRSNRLVILVGVLLAVVAFVGIVVLLNQQGGATAEIDDRVDVLVARQDIAIGDEVTPALVEVVKVDPEDVTGSALGDPSLLRNRPALTAIPEGAQVSAEVFGTLGNVDIDIVSQLQAGERAIAFQVDNVTGLGFLVKQGDIIDILLEQRITVSSEGQGGPAAAVPGLEGASTVKVVLQAKRVLYVSDSRLYQAPPAAEGEAAPAPAQFSTVLVVIAGTPADAELIKFAQRDSGVIGALTVVLRAAGDEQIDLTAGVTLDALVTEYGLRLPEIILAAD